ncbi:hypothetical protein D3C84_716620 [compost metagenome]
MSPQVHVAEIAAGQVTKQPCAGHPRVERLRFAIAGNDQPLRAELGHRVCVQVFHCVADKPVTFPAAFGCRIAFFIFIQRLQRFLTQTFSAEPKILRQE